MDTLIWITFIFLMRVGCDGVLGSDKVEDKCGVCGGNNTSCHIISGIFTRRSLPYGYNKVTTIPVGACNINITEIQPSGNYLALKLSRGGYILNGNWALGYSNDYPGAGTVFEYHRPLPRDRTNPMEYIRAKGPTNSSLDIMLLKQQDNRGLWYSYTIPMDKYYHVDGKDVPALRHARPPAPENSFISKKEYTEQVAALNSDSNVESGDPDQPQQDETGMTYEERYQAYLERLRQQGHGSYQSLNDRGTSAGTVQQKPVSSRTYESNSYQDQTNQDYNTRLQAYQQRLQEHERQKLVRQQQRSQTQGSGRLGQTAAQQQNPTDLSQYSPSRSASTQYQPSSQGGSVVPKPGINYGVPQNQLQPQSPQLQPQRQSQPQPQPQPQPVIPGRSLGQTYGQTANVPPVGQSQLPSNYQQPVGYHQGRVYSPMVPVPQPGTQQQYQPQTNYAQNPYQQQPYYNQDSVRQTQYQGSLGQVLPQRAGSSLPLGGAVNDQISLNLGTNRRPQLGIVDTTSDYSWKITGFTECTRTCGEGSQSTVIVCVKVSSQAIVTNGNCDNSLKPESQSIPCNTNGCPPAWEEEEWGKCSTTCDRGQQSRLVVCKQRLSSAVQISISATKCQQHSKPSIIRACNEDKPCAQWKVDEWSTCSSKCGRGQRTRGVVCVNADGITISDSGCQGPQPRTVEICDMGSCAKTWFYTEWSTECSSECGRGVFTRDTYCSASRRKCRSIDKPNTQKQCRSDIPCGGQWFTGPWGKCTVTCGQGVVLRDVTCIKKTARLLAIVKEENCATSSKPESEQPCQRPACKPQWYMTDWTECSKSCGAGFRSREVKCLDESKTPSGQCDVSIKPMMSQTCNTLACPETPPDPGCTDKFKNCLLVVQARLCRYDYYKNSCCLSCMSHNDHHDNT